MRRTGSLFLLCILIATAIFVAAGARSTQVIQGPEVEQFLKKARFTAREPLGSGVRLHVSAFGASAFVPESLPDTTRSEWTRVHLAIETLSTNTIPNCRVRVCVTSTKQYHDSSKRFLSSKGRCWIRLGLLPWHPHPAGQAQAGCRAIEYCC